jgi:hypothetical protein
MRAPFSPADHAVREVTTIQVVAEDGQVRLAWSDGVKDSYTVYKSADPRDLTSGEVHFIRGNIWTDRNPGTSPVVFYRIE